MLKKAAKLAGWLRDRGEDLLAIWLASDFTWKEPEKDRRNGI